VVVADGDVFAAVEKEVAPAQTHDDRRGVVLQGEVETDDVHFIFTAPQTTFGVTLQLMEHKGRGTGA
jgi:hypothetical protein